MTGTRRKASRAQRQGKDRIDRRKKRKEKHAAGCCCLVSWSYDECRGIRCRESVMRDCKRQQAGRNGRKADGRGISFIFCGGVCCLKTIHESWIFIRRPTPSNPPHKNLKRRGSAFLNLYPDPKYKIFLFPTQESKKERQKRGKTKSDFFFGFFLSSRIR